MSATAGVATREVIVIDEELCDGCGQCVPACAEGALQIVNGKARLVSEVYCDGMGACLGHCPQGAITIERRAAAAYDEAAVTQHLARQQAPPAPAASVARPAARMAPAHATEHHSGCPGAAARMFKTAEVAEPADAGHDGPAPQSQLRNWPVELKLAPLQAPYYDDAELLISADCVAFAHPDFHRRLLTGRTLLIGCPKLDDADLYASKLTEIIRRNSIKSISVAFMEVPCCFGLVALVKQALADSGKQLPASALRIGLEGDEQQRFDLQALPF